MPTANATPAFYTVENYHQQDSIGFLLHQAKVRLTQHIDEQISGHGITAAQWAVLKQMNTGTTASALCRCSGHDTGSMTRMLDRLEEKGLICRERSTTDRRVVELHTTPAGQELLGQVVPLVVNALNQSLQGFSAEEFELAKSLLRRMIGNLDEHREG